MGGMKAWVIAGVVGVALLCAAPAQAAGLKLERQQADSSPRLLELDARRRPRSTARPACASCSRTATTPPARALPRALPAPRRGGRLPLVDGEGRRRGDHRGAQLIVVMPDSGPGGGYVELVQRRRVRPAGVGDLPRARADPVDRRRPPDGRRPRAGARDRRPVDGRRRHDEVRRPPCPTSSSPRPRFSPAVDNNSPEHGRRSPRPALRARSTGPRAHPGDALARREPDGPAPRTSRGLKLWIRTGNGQPGGPAPGDSGFDPDRVRASTSEATERSTTA